MTATHKEIAAMPGADFMAMAAGAVRDVAARIRHTQDALVAAGMNAGWEPVELDRFAAAMAAARAIEVVREAGARAKARGEKPGALVQVVADVMRSEWISETINRSTAGAAARKVRDADVA